MAKCSAYSQQVKQGIKELHIIKEYILLSQSYRILLSLSCFTIHKDIFYSVAYMWHIFMIKYVYMDTYYPYTLYS